MINIRKASLEDLPFLLELEQSAFEKNKQSSKKSIENSIKSYNQKVLILEDEDIPCASATLFIHTNSIRVYSLAVLPYKQNKSYGKQLMNHVIQYCKDKYVNEVVLEADATNARLVKWYQSLGFGIVKELPNFYGANTLAYKMTMSLLIKSQKNQNIVVVDKQVKWLTEIDSIEIVNAKDYIVLEKYQKDQRARVFNLCSSYEYQTMGYYVSLLASARKQRIIPNVATIKDFTDSVITESIADDLYEEMQKTFIKIKDESFVLDVYFGKTLNKKYDKLANELYKLFESPLIRFEFKKDMDWALKSATPITLEDVDCDEELLKEFAKKYFNQKKFTIKRFKNFKYNLAILTDPTELTPPSCRMALKNFMHAAEKIGFYTEFITKNDYLKIPEFDALFIRATTNVNNFTYQFSRYAYAEGLAVIDDPWSILKCANKIYLAETMKKEGIKTPKTILVGKGMNYKNILDDLSFPIVLKEPDNAFGLGVFKADNMKMLEEILDKIFEISEIVLAQEFVKSSFDWRIGVLDNQPLYACKYYMAENHWQIEKWKSDHSSVLYGKHETLPVEQVPKEVIKTALKAANAMGDGLYGVDLKEINGNVYVIEVNDNPSIDYRVEDKVLKGKMYHKIIYSLYSRLEMENFKRFVSGEYKSTEK